MRRALRRLSRALLRGALSLAVGTAALVAYLATTTEVERARFERPRDAVTITDRHGTPLRHERSDGRDRRWVSLDQVSPHVVDAVLAVEDQRFRSHGGVDLRATARAGLSFALPGRRVSGASTITQQLIKLTHGRPDGLWDKPREILRAVMLERERDKDWILEQYLNRLPYGDQVVGVARASELYFGKPVSRLSVAEAALLAGIPQAPSALDPRRHLPAALRRRAVVLRRMRDTGRIDEATFSSASAEPAAIRARPVRPWRAPRFADAALEGWRDGSLSRSGQTLRTSLDLPLQREAERILRDAVERLEERGVTNGAAVVVSNQSGEVLAHVGAARGGESPGGWLDLARARRQPGSTLKPFVYELFFERGGTPASLLDDLSRPMVGGGGALFTARDYDGRERGPVRAREALSASLNLAALDAARQVGAERVVARLGELGVRELDGADRYGAAIVLGGADVTAFELAEAYVTLARGGTRVPLSLGRAAPEPRPVMDPAHAALTRDVLMDARARREAFGDDLSALFPLTRFGLKTGTSSGWRDAWTAAFTDEVTVVVWLGDPASRPLSAVSGFEGAAPPAVRLLAAAQARLEALDLGAPTRDAPTLATARICAVTGRLAGAGCSHTLDERFAPGHLPEARCAAHREDGTVALHARYARWLEANHPAGFSLAADPHAAGTPRVAHPEDGARLIVRGGAIPLRATVGGVTTDARWEIDGAPHGAPEWSPGPGEHELVAVLGASRSAPARVRIEEP
ncbi:MAG: transglycosylase domain-containing protein [Sandaracinaceae bacterium]